MLLAIWCYKDWGTAVSDLQYTLKGIQDEDQEWWISDLGNWQNRPLNSQIFSEDYFVSVNYYIISYLEKQKIINGFLSTNSNLLPRYALVCMYFFSKITGILTTPPPFQSSSTELRGHFPGCGLNKYLN